MNQTSFNRLSCQPDLTQPDSLGHPSRTPIDAQLSNGLSHDFPVINRPELALSQGHQLPDMAGVRNFSAPSKAHPDKAEPLLFEGLEGGSKENRGHNGMGREEPGKDGREINSMKSPGPEQRSEAKSTFAHSQLLSGTRDAQDSNQSSAEIKLTHQNLNDYDSDSAADDDDLPQHSNSKAEAVFLKSRFNHCGVEEEACISKDLANGLRNIRKVGPPAEICLESIQNLMGFDWSLKDISNLKLNPQNELTDRVFWFYVNALYFPFRALSIRTQPFETFAARILQNLKIIIINQEPSGEQQPENPRIPENLNAKLNSSLLTQQPSLAAPDSSLQSPMHQSLGKLPSSEVPPVSPELVTALAILKPLFRGKRFKIFKKLFKDLQDKAIIESFRNAAGAQPAQDEDMKPAESDCKEHPMDERLQQMIDILQTEVDQLHTQNMGDLKYQYDSMKAKYEAAFLADEEDVDTNPYSTSNMLSYGQEFLGYVEPKFVKDMAMNEEWYQQNYNEILSNINYPSRLEKDFLQHIEFVQQRKNDQKYKKILKRLEFIKKNGPSAKDLFEDEKASLSKNKRALVSQEDAQCAICNSGEYEDEDLIVFCGNCNIPVHQSCYGIEQLPEGDWICFNCDIFGFSRGLTVTCVLCPKKGGSMKPTNIFSTPEHFHKYMSSYTGHSKRSAKKSSTNVGVPPLQTTANVQSEAPIVIGENEDKNLSLSVILKREFDFQMDLREAEEKLLMSSGIKAFQVELQYEPQERENMIPDDYNQFVQRNTSRLESKTNPKTETLYQWVHFSCASWIPEPIVTPKTPVRLSKFDQRRFQLQCIICLKKQGACMQCQSHRCQIAFHVECARRAGYCMEIDKKDKEKKMFCEKHRPLKIVKEMEEKDRQAIDEIQKYCKIIDRCMEINARQQLKKQISNKRDRDSSHDSYSEQDLSYEEGKLSGSKRKLKEKSCNRQKSGCKREKKLKERAKKWRERDKKILFERVKEKFLLFRKLRINLVRVDNSKKPKKKSDGVRKRSSKRINKSFNSKACLREGLRSKMFEGKEIAFEDAAQILEEQKVEEIGGRIPIDLQAHERLGEQAESFNEKTETVIEAPEEELEEGEYFKLGQPMYPPELDWMITLSRNDFPWLEIRFDGFTSKDCYEKYISIVKDSQTFLKKVLGLKEKYKKLMQNQLYLNMQVPLAQVVVDNMIYCRCKGEVKSDLYVQCDGDVECINNQWLHPQCTTDLRDKTKEQLDAIEMWLCEDCVARARREEEEDQQEPEDVEMEEEEGSFVKDSSNVKEGHNQSMNEYSSSSSDESDLAI